jgi:hypothetical protein
VSWPRRQTAHPRRKRRTLEWTASHSHPFDFEIRRTPWPPFYATAEFLPTLRVTLTNKGEALDKGSVGVYVKEFGGPISEVASEKEGWLDTQHIEWDTRWEPGATRSHKVSVRPRNLPRAGTYAVRIILTRWIPSDTPYRELTRQLEQAGIPESQRKEIAERNLEELREFGIDPYTRPIGQFRGEQVFEGTVIDYFRVEDFSAVLTFFLVLGTLLTGLATLIVAITALVGS